MDEGRNPNLSLDPQPAGRPAYERERSPLQRLLWFLAAMSTLTVLVMAVLLIVVLLQLNNNIAANRPADLAALRTATMELEDKGLDLQAAESWQDYLERAGDIEDRAELLYRAGKLYLKSDKYSEAAVCFVRAETEAEAVRNETLVEKIGPKLIACLEKMGRPDEANRELSRRVEVGGKEKTGAVLATIGDEQIRESDVERMSRRYVDRVLAAQGIPSDSPARAQVERQMTSPAMQARILQEAVQMELLERRARELGLHEDPEYVETLRQATEGLLQQFLLQKEFDKIQTSATDLKNYFQAHKDRYGDAESADVLLVQLNADEDPKAVLGKIKTADDFRRWFEERRKAGEQGVAKTTLRKTAEMPPALAAAFDLAEGDWTKSPIELGPSKLVLLVEKKNPAKPQTFAEAEPAVRRDYLAAKRQEMLGKLMDDLIRRYNVRFLAATAPMPASGTGMAPPAATMPAMTPTAPQSPSSEDATATPDAKASADTQTKAAKEAATDSKTASESTEKDAAPEPSVSEPNKDQPEENQP